MTDKKNLFVFCLGFSLLQWGCLGGGLKPASPILVNPATPTPTPIPTPAGPADLRTNWTFSLGNTFVGYFCSSPTVIVTMTITNQGASAGTLGTIDVDTLFQVPDSNHCTDGNGTSDPASTCLAAYFGSPAIATGGGQCSTGKVLQPTESCTLTINLLKTGQVDNGSWGAWGIFNIPYTDGTGSKVVTDAAGNAFPDESWIFDGC